VARLSLRTRVAIASAVAAAAVVAAFTVLTTVVLANNDAAQLDRRLDSIVEASMFPEQLSDPKRGVLTTGRSRSTGQVVFQRGFQLPALPPGTETVEVNGIDLPGAHHPDGPAGRRHPALAGHPCRQHPVEPGQDPDLPRRRCADRAGGRWAGLAAGRARGASAAPAHRADQVAGPRRRAEREGRAGGRGTLRRDGRHAGPADRRPGVHHPVTAGRTGFRGQRRARTAHPADRDAGRLDTLRIHDLPAEEREEVVADLLRRQRRVEATI
jgi:hypothetical protein